jgi:hypothetical protein
VNFNRRDWPGSPDAGFYKPHSMLWVCPPGVCPRDSTALPLPPTAKSRLRLAGLEGVGGRLADRRAAKVRVVRDGDAAVSKVRVVVKDASGRVVARSRTLAALKGTRSTLTVRRVAGRRVASGRRYRVQVIGLDAQGKRVSGQSRTIRG